MCTFAEDVRERGALAELLDRNVGTKIECLRPVLEAIPKLWLELLSPRLCALLCLLPLVCGDRVGGQENAFTREFAAGRLIRVLGECTSRSSIVAAVAGGSAHCCG